MSDHKTLIDSITLNSVYKIYNDNIHYISLYELFNSILYYKLNPNDKYELIISDDKSFLNYRIASKNKIILSKQILYHKDRALNININSNYNHSINTIIYKNTRLKLSNNTYCRSHDLLSIKDIDNNNKINIPFSYRINRNNNTIIKLITDVFDDVKNNINNNTYTGNRFTYGLNGNNTSTSNVWFNIPRYLK